MKTRQPEWEFIANLGDTHPLDYGGLFVYRDKTGVYAPEMEKLEEPSDDELDQDERSRYTAERSLEKQYEAEHPDADWQEVEKYVSENLPTHWQSKLKWKVYRVCLDKCTYRVPGLSEEEQCERDPYEPHPEGILSDNKFHPDKCAWWAHPEARKSIRPQDTTYLSFVCYDCPEKMRELIEKFCSDDPLDLAWAYQEVFEHHGWENGDSYPLELSREEVIARYKNGELGKRYVSQIDQTNPPS